MVGKVIINKYTTNKIQDKYLHRIINQVEWHNVNK